MNGNDNNLDDLAYISPLASRNYCIECRPALDESAKDPDSDLMSIY